MANISLVRSTRIPERLPLAKTLNANALKRQVLRGTELEILAFATRKILPAYAAGLSERDLIYTKDSG